jgi:DNA-directed RNA polymerase sigma subunit (sigma70/sigma32)
MKCIYKEGKTGNCRQKECRHWMKFSADQNCALICVAKHGNLTLEEVGKRLKISHVRVKQIQDKAIIKLERKMRDDR